MSEIERRALCDAAWAGDFHTVVRLVSDPDVLRHGDPDTALLHASHRGHNRIAEVLLGCGADPRKRDSECLWRAARYGRGKVVKLLLPLSDTARWQRWQWNELSPAMRRRMGYSGGGS
jgi:ankyrin repeat protein